MEKNTRILVIYGGTSTEREVSLNSGRAVYNALLRAGFTNVELFDLKADNMADILSIRPDLAFLALHGKGGEDGTIQGLLELAGIPYTGSGVASSAVCMDKILTKRMLVSAGIPTAPFYVTEKSDHPDVSSVCHAIVTEVGLPAVLKSPCQGSSVGVYIVRCEADLPAAVEGVFSFGDRLLCEKYLDGAEITVPLLGNSHPRVLPIIEITSENEFYDYEAKYTAGMCTHIIPARIPAETAELVNGYAKDTYRLLGCRGVSRVDFIVDKEMGPMVVEVNTIPGMTEMSLLPDSARAAGISFEETVVTICELALEDQD